MGYTENSMSDEHSVTFHEHREFDEIPIARPEPRGFAYRLAKAGIVSSPGDAAILLAVSASILIALNLYLFAKSIPEPPTLGNDVLRSGETIPDYAK